MDLGDDLVAAVPVTLFRDREGTLFLTSNYRVADDLIRDANNASNDDVAKEDRRLSLRRHASDNDIAPPRMPLPSADNDDPRPSVDVRILDNSLHDATWRAHQGPGTLAATTIY